MRMVLDHPVCRSLPRRLIQHLFFADCMIYLLRRCLHGDVSQTILSSNEQLIPAHDVVTKSYTSFCEHCHFIHGRNSSKMLIRSHSLFRMTLPESHFSGP